jgi:hypothetical protein
MAPFMKIFVVIIFFIQFFLLLPWVKIFFSAVCFQISSVYTDEVIIKSINKCWKKYPIARTAFNSWKRWPLPWLLQRQLFRSRGRDMSVCSYGQLNTTRLFHKWKNMFLKPGSILRNTSTGSSHLSVEERRRWPFLGIFPVTNVTTGLETITYRTALLSILLHSNVQVFIEFVNEMGLQKLFIIIFIN